MANDHARIRRDIWGDDDWRDLSSPAQWLYMHLLTSPALTFCGTTDWRPSRIASTTGELQDSDVETFGTELTSARFILPDVESEEVMIRSWIKHDGLLRSPNMAKRLVKDHDRIASRILRGTVVDQLAILFEKGSEGAGWTFVEPLLKKRRIPFDKGVEILSANPSANPSGKGSTNPSGKGSGKGYENRATLHTPYSILQSPSSSSTESVPSPGARKRDGETGAAS